MKVLITGIAGFIGYHLARSLSAQGIVVSGFDNFNNYYDVDLKKHRAKILKKYDVNVMSADLRNLDSLYYMFDYNK